MLEEGREAQKPEGPACAAAQGNEGSSLPPALGTFGDVRVLPLYCPFSVVR